MALQVRLGYDLGQGHLKAALPEGSEGKLPAVQFSVGSSFKSALHRDQIQAYLTFLFTAKISPGAWRYNIMLCKVFLLRNAGWTYLLSHKW